MSCPVSRVVRVVSAQCARQGSAVELVALVRKVATRAGRVEAVVLVSNAARSSRPPCGKSYGRRVGTKRVVVHF